MSGASHFRGHLFADLRGSTAFTEQAGNVAGAELVRRFRELVRAEVSRHDGAEVKTEGDAIYVVFPSASTAVMCGLAIIDGATKASVADLPIRVGVGVHAGEAVPVAEGGYIGTAVNVAARVCALAQAGEVLVTSTVRGITQASIPVKFVARGRRRLKGISEPVDVYLVVAEGASVSAGRRPSLSLIIGATAVLAIVALVFGLAYALSPPGTSGATPSPTLVAKIPDPTPVTPRIGALAIGEYTSGAFQPPFTFAVTDPGWSLTGNSAGTTSFVYEGVSPGRLDVGRVSNVYVNPCAPSDKTPSVRTAAELLDALGGITYLDIGETRPVNLHGTSGLTAEALITNDVFAACDGSAELALFPFDRSDWTIAPGRKFRMDLLDLNGGVAVILRKSDLDESRSVNETEPFFAAAQKLIESISF